MKRLAICLPQGEMVRSEYATALSNMLLRIGADNAGIQDVSIIAVRSSQISRNRQAIAERAIEKRRATHLIWIDSDHSFPPDTAHRLLAHERPYVGINATTRNRPIQATAWKRRGERLQTTQHSKGLERAWRIGLGIAVIEARVFEAMSKPWFLVEWIDKDDGGYFCGEDSYFCEKAKASGFSPMVDHDLTKETTHIGPVGWSSDLLEEMAGMGGRDE
jgi:hypothetical protein